MGSGPWNDPITWWGMGTNLGLPGPDDNVTISPFCVVTGGGVCHNLTVMGHPSNYGVLQGPWNDDDSCQIQGDLVCAGMIANGASGVFFLEVWGNITLGSGAYIYIAGLNLTGSSGSLTGLPSISQDPNTLFYTSITRSTTFPGLRLLTDIFLNNDTYYGAMTGIEIYLYGHKLSGATLTNCFFSANAECVSGTVENCHLYDVESMVYLTTQGDVQMLDNDCVFQTDLTNNGTLSGPYSTAGSFSCRDLINNGILQPGWSATLTINAHGDIANNHTIYGDILFSSEVSHTWTEALGSTTSGSISNISPPLVLLSDLTLQTNQNFMAGQCDLNGHTVHNANVYNGTIISGGGAFQDCLLSGLTITGEVYLNGANQLADSNVVFDGGLCVNGSLSGVTYAVCHTYISGLFYNYGSIINGWMGSLSVHSSGGLSNYGQFSADYLYFEGLEANACLLWGPEAQFNCEFINLAPRMYLLGSSELNLNWRTWHLGTCLAVSPLTIANAVLPDAILEGSQPLVFSYASISGTQCYMPVHVGAFGLVVVGRNNVFHGDLIVNGVCSGDSYTTDRLVCHGNIYLVSGSLSNGYYGLLDVGLAGNLYLSGGDLQVNILTLAGNPLHIIRQDTLVSNLNATVDCTWGETVRLDTDLTADSGTLFRLGGSNLDLNSHTLSQATLGSGTVSNGTVSDCSAISMELSNITSASVLYLLDNCNVASGLYTNTGLLVGQTFADCQFTVNGDVLNTGNISPGYYGTMQVTCYGDVTNNGFWQAVTHIKGGAARTLNLSAPGYGIYVSGNSHPVLTGMNLLGTFVVEPGSVLTVGPGAELSMDQVDSFYIANTGGNGSFINQGTFCNRRSLSGQDPLSFYGLSVTPTAGMGYDYDQLMSIHQYGQVPPELPDGLGEIWSVIPQGFDTVQNGQMVFYHSSALFGRSLDAALELYYRPIGETAWQLYTGAFTYSQTEHSFTALDIPVCGDYTFVVSTLPAPTGLNLLIVDYFFGRLPKIQWDSVPGARVYDIWKSAAPNSGWSWVATTSETFWEDSNMAVQAFYRVVARR